MKNTVLALFVFILCATVSAQNSVQEWKAKAVEKYPALGAQGSEFNKAFVAEHNRLLKAAPESFRRADWPMRIADDIASDDIAASPKAGSVAQAQTPPATPNVDALPPPPPGFVIDPPIALKPKAESGPSLHPVLTDADFKPDKITPPAPVKDDWGGVYLGEAPKTAATKLAGASKQRADPSDFEVIDVDGTQKAAERAAGLRWAALAAVAIAILSCSASA